MEQRAKCLGCGGDAGPLIPYQDWKMLPNGSWHATNLCCEKCAKRWDERNKVQLPAHGLSVTAFRG